MSLIEHIPELAQDKNIKELIKKIRIVVVYFKRSAMRKTILQNYVEIEDGIQLSLLLDCKTWWNSLLTKLERFNLLKPAFKKLV